MLGAYFVFALAVTIVVTYMLIVHRFLVSSEEAQDEIREAKYRNAAPSDAAPRSARATQFAH